MSSNTQFAPVAGAQIYQGMKNAGKLGNYHLLLAHDIYARPTLYRDVFGDMEGPKTIILDNSVVELKSPIVDPEYVAQAAQIVGANVIVLPDVYLDAKETIKSIIGSYNTWKQVMDRVLGANNYAFMLVPQGSNIHKFTTCAGILSTWAEMEIGQQWWWGIPRNLVKAAGTRYNGIEYCAGLQPRWPIHMLGFSDNVIDDIYCAQQFSVFVHGIDSAVPVRYDGEYNITSIAGSREPGWLETAEYTQQVQRNIDYVSNLV